MLTNGSNLIIDIQLSLTKVARIVEENAGVQVTAVEKLGQGLEFQTFLVNNTWVFRFPIHYSETHDPNVELRFCRRLKLSATVPRITFIWKHPWGYPVTVSGYKYLPGQALEAFHPTELDQALLAQQLAMVLTELHQMNECGANDAIDQMATLRTWAKHIDEELRSLADRSISNFDHEAIKSYVDQYRFDLSESGAVQIHGDLGADHILLNDEGHLSGIIDWSNHTQGNRYRDFVGLWRWGGDAFCAQVLSYYVLKPNELELAFVRVMGLVSCIAREVLLSIHPDGRLLTLARSILQQRVSEITGKCPYESLVESR